MPIKPYNGASALTTQAVLNNQNALRVFSRIEIESIQKLKIISRVLGIALHLNMFAMAIIPVLFPPYWWVMLVGGLGGGLIFQIPRSFVNSRIAEKQKTHAALKVSLALLSQDPSKKEYFPKGLGDLKAVDQRLRSDLRFEDQREKERPPAVSSIKARVDHLDLAVTPANNRTFALESAALKAGLEEPFPVKELQKQVVAARAFLEAGDHAGYEKEIQRIQKAAMTCRSVFARTVCQPKKADESVKGCFKQVDLLLKDIALAPRSKVYRNSIETYKTGRQLFLQAFNELANKKGPKAKKEREKQLIALKTFIVKLTAFKEKVVSNTTSVSFESARASFTNFMGRFEAFVKLIKEAKALANCMPFLGDDQTFKSLKSKIKKFEEDKVKIETFILDLEKKGNLGRVTKAHLNGYIALLDLRLNDLHQKLKGWLEGHVERRFQAIEGMLKEVDQIDISKKTPEFKKSRRALQKKVDAFKLAFTKVKKEKDYQTQLNALEKFESEVTAFKTQFTIITRKEFWKASYKAVFAPPQPVQKFAHERRLKAVKNVVPIKASSKKANHKVDGISPVSKTQTVIDKLLRVADRSFMRRHITYRVFDLVVAIIMTVAIALFYENPWLFMGLASISVLRTVGHEIIGYALNKARDRVKELKMKDAFRGRLAPFRPKGFSEAQLEAHKTTQGLAKRCRLAVQELEKSLVGVKNKAQRERCIKEVRSQIKEVRSQYAEIARKNFVSPVLV